MLGKVSPPKPPARHRVDRAIHGAALLTSQFTSAPARSQAKPAQSQAHPTLVLTNPGTRGCRCPREHRKPELGTPGPPTPADLLGVAHGLQDRMVQGLQGGQDVLIVPHVVHKVIWGRRERRSGVTGGFCPFHQSPCAPYSRPPGPLPPHLLVPALPDRAPTTQLLGVHVAAEREREGGLRSRPVGSHPPALPPQRARPTQLVKRLVLHSMPWHCEPFTGEGAAGKCTNPSEGPSRAPSAPQST